MASTITFYTFVKRTPAYGQHLENNFANFRGNVLPLSETEALTTHLEASLGQPLNSWKDHYTGSWRVSDTNAAALFIASSTAQLGFWNTMSSTNPGHNQWQTNGTTGSMNVVTSTSTSWTKIPGTTLTVASRQGLPVEIRVTGQLTFPSAKGYSVGSFEAGMSVFTLFENGSAQSVSGYSSLNAVNVEHAFNVAGTGRLEVPIDWTFYPTYYTSTAVNYDIRVAGFPQTVTVEEIKVMGREVKNG